MNPILDFALANPLTVLNLGLLLLTLTLSYFSYTAQRRNSTRESIEQLDDLYINNSLKVKPLLHEFKFGPLRPSSSIHFQFLNPQNDRAAVATRPATSIPLLHISRLREIEKYLHRTLDVSGVQANENSIEIQISSRNPVLVRATVEEALSEILHLHGATNRGDIDEALKE